MLDLFTFQAIRLSARLCFRERVGNCQEHTVLVWLLVLFQPLNPQHNAGILLNQGLVIKLQSNCFHLSFCVQILCLRLVLSSEKPAQVLDVRCVSLSPFSFCLSTSLHTDPMKAVKCCCVNGGAFQSLDLFRYSH